MSPSNENLCQCTSHDPPLFAACGAKAAPESGETQLCSWCWYGHQRGLDTLKCIGRTVGKSLRFWARRTFR